MQFLCIFAYLGRAYQAATSWALGLIDVDMGPWGSRLSHLTSRSCPAHRRGMVGVVVSLVCVCVWVQLALSAAGQLQL